ncbi:dihydrodipicolinate synthetase, partial [Pseudomonas aeruginosa]
VSPFFVFRIRIQSDRCGPGHRATAAFAVVGDPVRAGSVSARPLPAVGRGGQQWPPGQVSDSR